MIEDIEHNLNEQVIFGCLLPADSCAMNSGPFLFSGDIFVVIQIGPR